MLPSETALVPYSPDSASGSSDGDGTNEQEQGQMNELSQQSSSSNVDSQIVQDLTEVECTTDSAYLQHLRQFLNALADQHRDMYAKIQTVLVENLPLGRTRTPRQFKLVGGTAAVALSDINADAYVECGLPLTAFYFLCHFEQAQHITAPDMHYHIAKYFNNMAREILQRKNRNEIIAREIPDMAEGDEESSKTSKSAKAANRSQGKKQKTGAKQGLLAPKTKGAAAKASAKSRSKFTNGFHLKPSKSAKRTRSK